MEYSSMPSYPPPLPPRSAHPQPQRERRLTPRQARVLVDLARLAGIVALIACAWQIADALRRPSHPPPGPLPFAAVAERFDRVRVLTPADEAFEILGPQRYALLREPEMDDYDRLVEPHPDRYPGERSWAKWADPDDPGRWVAVLICGGSVYHTLKRDV